MISNCGSCSVRIILLLWWSSYGLFGSPNVPGYMVIQPRPTRIWYITNENRNAEYSMYYPMVMPIVNTWLQFVGFWYYLYFLVSLDVLFLGFWIFVYIVLSLRVFGMGYDLCNCYKYLFQQVPIRVNWHCEFLVYMGYDLCNCYKYRST